MTTIVPVALAAPAITLDAPARTRAAATHVRADTDQEAAMPDHAEPDHAEPDQPDPDQPAPASEQEPGPPGSATDSPPERGSAGPRHPGGPGSSTDPNVATELARPMTPPKPPKRTGVFVEADDLREHVGGLLRAILGGHEVDAFGNFTFTHEDARVFITIAANPMGPQVGVFSVTNLDVELTPELASFLLTTNHTLGFGSFSYDRANRAVWLRHTLLGTTLDLPELQTAVVAVASTAAAIDDHIRDEFGGRTFQDAPSEVQRRMEPPSTDPGDGRPSASGYL